MPDGTVDHSKIFPIESLHLKDAVYASQRMTASRENGTTQHFDPDRLEMSPGITDFSCGQAIKGAINPGPAATMLGHRRERSNGKLLLKAR